MAIPSYQELMLPLLKLLARKDATPLKEASKILSDELKLTEEEKARTISQGRMTYMQNRLSWRAIRSRCIKRDIYYFFQVFTRRIRICRTQQTI
ncbi:MAG: winged helix-turn-helix domain-containing protein [Ignavibacteria bacterium]|jgi:restriction endonuclease Mrr